MSADEGRKLPTRRASVDAGGRRASVSAGGRRASAADGTRRASATVGLQERTHKGGAVLWFLRKHAPMPTQNSVEEAEPPKIARVMKSVAAAAGASAATRQNTQAKNFKALNTLGFERDAEEDAFAERTRMAARKPKQTSLPPPVQARFLHQLSVSIGAEIDEVRRTAPSPSVAAVMASAGVMSSGDWNGGPMSSRCRDDLRRGYAAHADAECAKLRARVARRDAEVSLLRRQVDQLTDAVAASRLAAARRKQRFEAAAREREGAPSAALPAALPAGVGVDKLLKLKQQFLRASTAVVYDAESSRPSYHRSADAAFEENLREKIDQHWEEEQTMRSMLEDQMHQLHQQTITRKASEAALFGKRMEILELRSSVLKAEARVTRLANDLRRVYKQLPEVVRQKLEHSAPQRQTLKKQHVQDLHTANVTLHFKWLDHEAIIKQSEELGSNDQALFERTQSTEQVLQTGNMLRMALLESLDVVDTALSQLSESWNKLTLSLASGILTVRDRDIVRNAAEQVFDLVKDFESVSSMAREGMHMLECDTAALVKSHSSDAAGTGGSKDDSGIGSVAHCKHGD
mmetsp:Transcript_20995/g.60677  ORF Transcript_20995/g.60677 Transcript_20995/m.60677 type:complete len:575 (+) Transcript_20995:144-1868(+)